MSNSQIERDIRQRVADFSDELAALLRQAAQQAVAEALAGDAAPRRAGKRMAKRAGKRAGKRGAKKAGKKVGKRGVKKAAPEGASGRPGRPPLQPEAETQRFVERIKKYLGSNPDSRLEEIGAELKASTKQLKRPIYLMLENDELSTTGQRRGMRYRLK